MMILKRNWHISRRTMLRGVGASLALPMLDAMQLPARAAAKSAKPPVRMAHLFVPNGKFMPMWTPKGEGREWELSPSMEPLKDLRDDILVLSRFQNTGNHADGDGHYVKMSGWLTGAHIHKTKGKDLRAGISVDQLAAKELGLRTPLSSLVLGVEPVHITVDNNVGYTTAYGSHISWHTPTTPAPHEIDPRQVFIRLFGEDGKGRAHANTQAVKDDKQSILDLVLDDAKRLRGELGGADRRKLDEYLNSVRTIEKRIHAASKSEYDPYEAHPLPDDIKPPAGIPKDFDAHIKLMIDLTVLSFMTDQTRIGTLMFSRAVSGRSYPFIGVPESHHSQSHHSGEKEKQQQYQKVNKYHTSLFAYMLRKLKAVKEGEGTLLDNCMIVYGSGIGDGNAHDPHNMPIIIGGRGGGTIDTGRHVMLPKGTPFSNLHVSMLNRIGVPTESFGASTGELKALNV